MEVGTLININEQLLKGKFIIGYNTLYDVPTFTLEFHYKGQIFLEVFFEGQ